MDDRQEGGVASRQESAKLHDDSQLIESMAEDAGLSGAHAAGGNLARDVATRDELKQVAGEAGTTRPRAADDVRGDGGQRKTGHEGAQGEAPGGKTGNASL